MVRRTPLTREEKIAQMSGLRESAQRFGVDRASRAAKRADRSLTAPAARPGVKTDADRLRDVAITKASQPLLATSRGRVDVLEDPTGQLTGIKGFVAGQEGTQARTFATSQAAQKGQEIIAQRTQAERQRVLSEEAKAAGIGEGALGFDEQGQITVNIGDLTKGQTFSQVRRGVKSGMEFSGEFSSDPEIAKAQRDVAQARGTGSANIGTLEQNLRDVVLRKLGRRDVTDITAQLTEEEQQRFATQQRQQELDIAIGGAGGVDPQLAEASNTLASMGITTLGLRRDAQGNFFIDPDAEKKVELDPFKRAAGRLAEDENIARQTIARRFKEAENRITERFTFLTGPRAGQLTEQGRRAMSKLKTQRDRESKDINTKFERGLEDLIIQEKGRQETLEAQERKRLEGLRDPGKQLRLAEQQAMISRINAKLQSGEAADVLEASALVKREISALGRDATDAQVYDEFRAALRSTQTPVTESFDTALQFADNDLGKAQRFLKAAGVPDQLIEEQTQDYQVNVLGVDPKYVTESSDLQKLMAAKDRVFSNPDATGLDIFQVANKINASNFGEGADLFKKSFYQQVIDSPNTNEAQRFNAQLSLKAIADKEAAKSVNKVEYRTVGNTLYALDPTDPFNPKAVASKAVLEGASQDTVNNWALSIADGFSKISNVPDDIRSQVNNEVQGLLRTGYRSEHPFLTEAQQDRALQLAKQINSDKAYGDMIDVKNGFDTISVVYSDDDIQEATGFQDIAAINAFQRMVDPGATVREGDVELLQTTIPALQKYGLDFAIKKFKKGDKLPADIRKSLRDAATDIYSQKAGTFNETVGKRFKFMAEQANIPFSAVGSDFPVPGAQGVGVAAPAFKITQDMFNTFQTLTPEQLSELTDEELDALESFQPEEQPTQQLPATQGLNRPERNNNPINIKAGGVADEFAEKNPDGTVKTDEQGHLIFATAADGVKGGQADLKAKVTGGSRFLEDNPTIAELGKVFAEDPNWARGVASILGVDPSTKTQDVDFNTLFSAVSRQEGGSRLLTLKP